MYGILIVEDNAMDAKVLSFLVEKMNYTSHIASSAIEAVELLEKYHIDLILLDWMLPHVNGMDLLKTLRSHAKYSKIPVIVVSSKNELKDVQKAIKIGASDYLIKPVDSAILEVKLQRFLGREVAWTPVKLGETDEAHGTASIGIRILRISEVGIEIETDLPVENGALLELSIPLFKEAGVERFVTKVFETHKEKNSYRLKCSIVGLKESDLQKVRLKIRALQRNEVRVAA